jgi:hypothetical protein
VDLVSQLQVCYNKNVAFKETYLFTFINTKGLKGTHMSHEIFLFFAKRDIYVPLYHIIKTFIHSN